jgi:hypothetical protein
MIGLPSVVLTRERSKVVTGRTPAFTARERIMATNTDKDVAEQLETIRADISALSETVSQLASHTAGIHASLKVSRLEEAPPSRRSRSTPSPASGRRLKNSAKGEVKYAAAFSWEVAPGREETQGRPFPTFGYGGGGHSRKARQWPVCESCCFASALGHRLSAPSQRPPRPNEAFYRARPKA